MGSIVPERNHQLRVMSTPTWPVPYYDRAFRHPTNLDEHKGDIGYVAVKIHDTHVMIAKEMLKLQGKGHVVEAVEQHFKIKNYLTSFENSKQFCEAYTDDLLDCLGVAHEQNVKLLNEHDFADVFN